MQHFILHPSTRERSASAFLPEKTPCGNSPKSTSQLSDPLKPGCPLIIDQYFRAVLQQLTPVVPA